MKAEYLFSQSFLRSDIVIFNIAALVTFTICGLWHGIGWNFLIWGLMHGTALAIQKSWSHATRMFKKGRGPGFKKVNRIAGTILTFGFVTISWVFFRMSTPEESLTVFSQISGNFYASGFPAFVLAYYPILLMITLGYTLHFIPDIIQLKIRKRLITLGWPWKALLAIAMISIIVYFKSLGSANPIYIQF
jgi:D-alanyl-lipoteichoic acid acyltransferase DltB (MBOAT superfamily)